VEGARRSIEFSPAKRIVVGWRKIDHVSVAQLIAADVTIRRIACAHDRRCCEQRTKRKTGPGNAIHGRHDFGSYATGTGFGNPCISKDPQRF
jgi:hypothetical protein